MGARAAALLVREGMDDEDPDRVGAGALERLRRAIGAIGALGSVGRAAPARERQSLISECDRAVAVLTTLRAELLVEEEVAGTWSGRGDRSLDAWRGRTAGIGDRAAAAQVRQAHVLADVPGAAQAVVEGRMTLEHVDAIARLATTGSPAQRAAAQSDEGRRELLDMAQRSDAGSFARSTRQWAASVDRDGHERSHQAQRAERFLAIVDSARGTLVQGQLDHMAGHRLRLALEAVTYRRAADDDRDHAQRCADALDEIATRSLAATDTKPGAQVRPSVSLIVSAGTWAAVLQERRRVAGDPRIAARSPVAVAAADPGAGADAGADPGAVAPDSAAAGRAPDAHVWPPRPTLSATLEDGTPVPASEVARILCDCSITRVVMDALGVPLDVGRTQRTYAAELRRAIIARDGECAWPSCSAHARWCEIHHIAWWGRDDGSTSVDNGVLLCGFHHHEVHRRDLTIRRRVPVVDRAAGRSRREEVRSKAAYEFVSPGGVVVGRAWGGGPGVRVSSSDLSTPGASRSRPLPGSGGTRSEPLTALPEPPASQASQASRAALRPECRPELDLQLSLGPPAPGPELCSPRCPESTSTVARATRTG